MCRFYDATTGTVSLFGHNVKEYGFTQLRRMVGIVPQQAVLFTGTIRDNMRWAAPDATDEEIWQALEIAQAADFVRTKPVCWMRPWRLQAATFPAASASV